MTRTVKTAHEIHDEVARMVQQIPEILEDGEAVEVGWPMPLEASGEGPTWTIDHVGNGRAYLSRTREVIAPPEPRWARQHCGGQRRPSPAPRTTPAPAPAGGSDRVRVTPGHAVDPRAGVPGGEAVAGLVHGEPVLGARGREQVA